MGSLDFIFKCDVKLLEGFKEVNYMILFLFKNYHSGHNVEGRLYRHILEILGFQVQSPVVK